MLHGGRLITIFSASRYCGTQTNKGAFITFGADLQPEIQQFYAHNIASSDFGATVEEPAAEEVEAEEERREQKLEDDAVQMIIEHVVNHKADLYWYYTQQDTENTGYVRPRARPPPAERAFALTPRRVTLPIGLQVSRLDWAAGLSSVLERGCFPTARALVDPHLPPARGCSRPPLAQLPVPHRRQRRAGPCQLHPLPGPLPDQHAQGGLQLAGLGRESPLRATFCLLPGHARGGRRPPLLPPPGPGWGGKVPLRAAMGYTAAAPPTAGLQAVRHQQRRCHRV